MVSAAVLFLAVGGAGAQEPESGRRQADRPFIGADYAWSWFHGDLDPWHLGAVSVGRRGPRGTFIGRVTAGRRFGLDGVQGEIDAYPRINDRLYAYLNVGYSGADIFPDWRTGAELFANLPRAWEGSIGYRQLRFDGSPVTLVTGSVGKYVGNAWISARPYLRIRDAGTSATVAVTARRYFADGDNYVGARVSAGSSPSERGDPTELARTSAWSAGVQASRTVRPNMVGTASAGVEREVVPAFGTRRRLDLSAGVRRYF